MSRLSTSVLPWILGDVLDRHDSMNLAATCVGRDEFPEGLGLVIAENVVGGSREQQPRTIRQLALELTGSPACVAQIKQGPPLRRARKRLHGIELRGDVDVRSYHQARQPAQ